MSGPATPELPDRDHKAGCPAVMRPDRPARIESYVLHRPPRIVPDTGKVIGPRQPVKVTRCLDCAAATYRDIDHEEAAR